MTDLSPEYVAMVAAHQQRLKDMARADRFHCKTCQDTGKVSGAHWPRGVHDCPVCQTNSKQPDDPGVRPFHLDFASHDAALMAWTWRTAFFTLVAAAIVTALILWPYFADNWTRITHAVACSEEVV